MSWFSDLLHGGANPADKANEYLSQIPGVSHGVYDPYIGRGNQAGDILSKRFGEMSNDPMAFINKIMQGYNQSDAYKFKADELGRAMGNSAAAGGMRGSFQDQENQAKLVQGLMGEDMQQWLQNVLGVNAQGLSGEQGLYGTGFNASSNLENTLASNLGAQGQYAYAGQAGQNQNRANMLSNILKGVGAVATAPMTGGGSLIGYGASQLFGGNNAGDWHNPDVNYGRQWM